MSSMISDPDCLRVRKGLQVIYMHPDITPGQVLELANTKGEELKPPQKSRVERVGEWVVKSSATSQPLRLIKHTLMRKRYRQSWIAAHHLMQHGVNVPRPVAFVETELAGIIAGHKMITEYLGNHRNVEDYMRSIIELGGGSDTIRLFLERLADAINCLVNSGAYHADLSGKNIFTLDGNEFTFLDLDAVELDKEYTDELRMKNHIQLYDSFRDMLSDALLTPFIAQLLTDKQDLRVWMPKVRKGQQERRLKQEKIWAKQGKL